MEIKELNISLNGFTDDKSTKIHTQFVDLLNELRKQELPENIVRSLNLCVEKNILQRLQINNCQSL
jgi:phage regulator Rha-like protein